MLRPYVIDRDLPNLHNLHNLLHALSAQYPEFCCSIGLASICVCGIGIRT